MDTVAPRGGPLPLALIAGLLLLIGLLLLPAGAIRSGIPGSAAPAAHGAQEPPSQGSSSGHDLAGRPAVEPGSAALTAAEDSLSAGHGPATGTAWACQSSTGTVRCGGGEPTKAATTGSATWINLSKLSTVAPPAGNASALAYDAYDGYVMLYDAPAAVTVGGATPSTWEYVAGVWTKLSPATEPPSRIGEGMVYDWNDGYVVMYGGTNPVGGKLYDDTWMYRSGTWREITASSTGTARAYMSMVYDPVDQYVLMTMGGPNPGHSISDTWTFSGGFWTQLTSVNQVGPARSGAAIVYDAADGYVMLYGGYSGAGGLWNDLWIWNPSAYNGWRNFGTQPAMPRVYAGMTYDPVDGEVLLFGGNSLTGTYNDTWAYKSGTWTNLTSSHLHAPPATYTMAVLDDYAAPFVLTFGGITAAGWENTTYTFETPPVVSASVSPTPADAAEPVNFSGNVTGGSSPDSVRWDFGDGSNATVPVAAHRFAAAGTYVSQFWAQDAAGVTSSVSIPVTIDPPLGALVTLGPRQAVAPLTATFHAVSTGGAGPTTVRWDFGDGTNSTFGNATHLYANPGTFPGRVWVNDSVGASSSESFNITVLPPLHAQIVLSSNDTRPRFQVNASAVVTGGNGTYSYAWTLNGTAVAPTGPIFSIVPPGAASYRIGLTVSDRGGDQATSSSVLVVLSTPSPLVVSLHLSASVVSAGTAVTALASSTGATGSVSYSWSLNGSSSLTASGTNITLVLTHAADYVVTVRGQDSTGAANSSSATLDVLSPTGEVSPLSVAASSSLSSVVAGSPFTISGSASGGIAPYTYVWALNGTNTSTSSGSWTQVVLHAGTYAYTLWATDARGAQAHSVPVVVSVTGGGSGGPGGGPSGSNGTASSSSSSLTSLLSSPWIYVLLGVNALVLTLIAVVALRRRSREPPEGPEMAYAPLDHPPPRPQVPRPHNPPPRQAPAPVSNPPPSELPSHGPSSPTSPPLIAPPRRNPPPTAASRPASSSTPASPASSPPAPHRAAPGSAPPAPAAATSPTRPRPKPPAPSTAPKPTPPASTWAPVPSEPGGNEDGST